MKRVRHTQNSFLAKLTKLCLSIGICFVPYHVQIVLIEPKRLLIMPRISIAVFRKFIKAIPYDKVIKKATTTERGQRIWPSGTHKKDQAYNFRLDKGSNLPDGRQEIIIQANKNAENKGVRQSAQANSHDIVAKVIVDPENDPEGKNIPKDAEESFKERN